MLLKIACISLLLGTLWPCVVDEQCNEAAEVEVAIEVGQNLNCQTHQRSVDEAASLRNVTIVLGAGISNPIAAPAARIVSAAA